MQVLFDTGILLDSWTERIPITTTSGRRFRKIRSRGDAPATSAQYIAQFWNVCTRPASARGGYGLSIEETDRRVRVIYPVTGPW